MKKCDECGDFFEPLRSNSRFCSAPCANRYHVRAYRKRKAAPPHESRPASCLECGNVFDTIRDDQAHCSASCHSRAWARQKAEGRARMLAETSGLVVAEHSPHGAYQRQRADADAEGLEWDVPYDEWWRMWMNHWNERSLYRLYRLDRSKGYISKNVAVMTVDTAAVYYEEPLKHEEIV